MSCETGHKLPGRTRHPERHLIKVGGYHVPINARPHDEWKNIPLLKWESEKLDVTLSTTTCFYQKEENYTSAERFVSYNILDVDEDQ